MMISFNVGDSMKFSHRAAGILIVNKRILVQRIQGDDYWFLPGGRVEMMEDSLTTIDREIKEEYGWIVDSKTLKIIVENFFELDGIKIHEVGMYYTIELKEPVSICEEEFTSVEDNLISKWIKIEELNKHNIVPSFIRNKKDINNILSTDIVKHIVSRDNEKCATTS